VDVANIGEIMKSDRLDSIYKPRILTRSVSEPVMASPWLFLIMVLLFCAEWTVRRLRDLP